MLILSLVTEQMIKGLGVAGTFGVFGVVTLIGGFYLSVEMKQVEGLS